MRRAATIEPLASLRLPGACVAGALGALLFAALVALTIAVWHHLDAKSGVKTRDVFGMLVMWAIAARGLYGANWLVIRTIQSDRPALFICDDALIYLHSSYSRVRLRPDLKLEIVSARRGYGKQRYLKVSPPSGAALWVPGFVVDQPLEQLLSSLHQVLARVR